MKKSIINTKNGKIWYSVYGEKKKGVPLLVLHGGPGFLSMPEVVKNLSNERPVYFYDQLGCGRSDRAADKSYYSVTNYIEELVQVRKKLGLKETYLMGFSWGTMLTCSYLLEKKPKGIKGLILSGPYLSSRRWHADQRENIANLAPGLRKIIEEAEIKKDYGKKYESAMIAYYQKHVCRLRPWPKYLKDAFSRLNMDVYLTMWGPSEFTITGTLKNYDLLAQLNKIKQPVLLTCGDYDEAGVKTVKDYQMAFKNASMAVLPNSSHTHHLEKPDLFLQIVRSFIKGID
ncbi:MAG: proline iminopeptidase-family hydrolase [Candidatus Omnitrophica bacterium]|nr:proline iminopeptidase-family hydrolase [Candidatus Omnitrophota bacterium]MCF7877355.1 proline iminopeptidase-family hydrolase [Candidatus Omnitrophota bacterium]MCF7892209.1 proline iminopeptidase-family hydrolase [Candidatus Omnitrophota bacterium]MCF7895458.1 proline iminopeptidase-family hydrolase [Candidatus Omnitrophota bacterium]MCF7897838.1 proline iminopeptidase-family hydrolase [Candidatus Omnitrophota bacterium]